MAIERDESTGAPRAHRYWRVLGQVLAWTLVATLGWLIWPAALGGSTSFVVVSGNSMEPTYESGDLVIARSGQPQVGDVIVYAPDSLGGAQVVHRVISGDAQTGWQVQGDNNDFVDPFFPSGSEVRGVVQVHVPHAGVVTRWLLNPLVWAALVLAGTVIAIWPPARSKRDDGVEHPGVERPHVWYPDGGHPHVWHPEVEHPHVWYPDGGHLDVEHPNAATGTLVGVGT